MSKEDAFVHWPYDVWYMAGIGSTVLGTDLAVASCPSGYLLALPMSWMHAYCSVADALDVEVVSSIGLPGNFSVVLVQPDGVRV